MSGLLARVEKGRLVLDEPTDLPEGTVVSLVADDEGNDLTDDERRALHEHCQRRSKRLRQVGFVLPRKFWTSCADARERQA